ncbi:MAG: glycosyltransferase [Desulfuromonadaceae bacterium]|nr:glycosyltransferase [Desulfuromonadaceae bacterium]MDD5104839.1 glycosyltransferase [Desulfuromonadaceae bacterium]
MNILIVDEEIPWPLNTGKRIRTYNLVQRLQENHIITYLCYGESGSSLPDCPNVTLIALPSTILEQKGARFYGALLTNLLSAKPYIVDRHFSDAFEQKALSLIASGLFDLVHCEWTPYTENIRTLIGTIPSVLSAHNVEAQIWERYHESETNLLKKIYIYFQWQKLIRYEANSARNYSEVSVVSEPDRDTFVEKYGCKRVTVVPNGVDEQYFAPLQSDLNPGSMVFTGSMDWRPNQDGVKYFIDEIFPLIKQRIPVATFTVVGRKPPQWLIALAERVPGVTVTGTVDDVRPYIASSMLYVVPLRVGGGSRLKILEAMAMEKVVLSTTVGAEGLDVVEGKQILLRDTPHDFADAACAVLNNPDRYLEYGAAGRTLILESYTWDAIARVMDDVWRRARV